jgi:hypothetical protein
MCTGQQPSVRSHGGLRIPTLAVPIVGAPRAVATLTHVTAASAAAPIANRLSVEITLDVM